MAIVIKAPNPVPEKLREYQTIFLAGSIDMGKAVNWQDQVINSLIDCDVLVLNPHRDQWNPDLVQDISNPQFKEQVVWELTHLESADFVIFYFDPVGQAPITLLELGLCIDKDILVCCPPGYWRRGNVQVLCDRYGIKLYDDLEDLIAAVKRVFRA